MKKASLPFRYARAWVNIAQEADELEPIKAELAHLHKLITGEKRLLGYLADVVVPRRERRALLTQLLESLPASTAKRGEPASELVRRFCYFLLERERFAWFVDIVSAYHELCDEIEGVIRAQVVSPSRLDPVLSNRIEKLLCAKTGKQVLVQYREDPSLIGGVVIYVGSRVYDGSVKGDLKRAQEEILK